MKTDSILIDSVALEKFLQEVMKLPTTQEIDELDGKTIVQAILAGGGGVTIDPDGYIENGENGINLKNSLITEKNEVYNLLSSKLVTKSHLDMLLGDVSEKGMVSVRLNNIERTLGDLETTLGKI